MRAILFALVAAVSAQATACTIFVCAKDGRVLAGNNEDYYAGNSKTWLNFQPKGERRFGCVGWGYEFSPFPQGGMNEAGLFYDGNALPDKTETPAKGKAVDGQALVDLMYRMLHECRTIQEAALLLRQYDITALAPAQLVIGDATGNSLIIERTALTWGNRSLQVGTNFRTSTTPAEKITCDRHRAVTRIMGADKPLTVDLAASALQATHQSGNKVQTYYSTICDLKAAKFWLYVRGNFAKSYEFDLKRELAKGEHKVDMADLK
jgi:hypothetical protein